MIFKECACANGRRSKYIRSHFHSCNKTFSVQKTAVKRFLTCLAQRNNNSSNSSSAPVTCRNETRSLFFFSFV